MSMRPELVRAIVTASLARTQDDVRRQLVSKDEARRIRAEDAIAAAIIVELPYASSDYEK